MTQINSYKVKRGHYSGIEDVVVYLPSSAVFIRNNTNCRDGLHDNHWHFIGICPYKDYIDFMNYIDNEDNGYIDYTSEVTYLCKDWALFSLSNINDDYQFNCVSSEEFNKITDFSKYCIASFNSNNGKLEMLRKIKYINSVSDIEVIDISHEYLETNIVDLLCLFFNNIHSAKAVCEKNTIINMYWKQMVYNALTSMNIPCNKSFNKNIDFYIFEILYSDIINFNFTDEDIKLYDKLIKFKTYKKM